MEFIPLDALGTPPQPLPRRRIRRPIARYLSHLVRPQRRNSFAFAKWLLTRGVVLLLLALLLLDLVVPIAGKRWIPSRRERPPIAPGGLALVDTLPSQRPYTADIVFVHGLGSFPDSTWLKRRPDKARTLADYEETSWVRDLLPEDIPQARLLFYNYDSTYLTDAPNVSLDDLADNLLFALSNDDRSLRYTNEERERPIIFICHSYGGLLVKKALTRANREPARYSNLLHNVNGAIFLGTPHKGARYTWYLKTAVARLDRLGSNPDILLPLEVNSTALEVLHDNFMWNFGEMAIFNFYETRKQTLISTPIFNLPRKALVVQKSSATFEAPNTVNVALDTDHSGLNKFNTGDDWHYILVVRAVRRLLRRLDEQRRETRRIELQEEAQHRLNVTGDGLADTCYNSRRYSVPWRTVSTFTDRTALQRKLDKYMDKTDIKTGPRTSVALWGAGATGKSQLALRFAEEHRGDYSPIIWIDATSPSTAIKSYHRAFQALELDYPTTILDEYRKIDSWHPHYKSMIADDWVVSSVIRWLDGRFEPDCKWLVVIDNADDISWIQDLIPTGPHGAVIITSRDSLVVELANNDVEVDHMSMDEGLQLLLSGIASPHANLSLHASGSRETIALKQSALPIVEALGRSPFALDLANRYIRHHPQVVENLTLYLEYHDEMSLSLLENPVLGLENYYRFTLATVYETSLTQVQAANNDSVRLLYLFALMSHDMIEDRLFREASISLSGVRQLHATYQPLLLFIQALICFWLPYGFVLFVVRFSPWVPQLDGRARRIVRKLAMVAPVLLDALYLLALYLLQQWMIDYGYVVTKRGQLEPDVVVAEIYLGLAYAWPHLARWILQEDLTGFWFRTLPYTLPTVILIYWGYTKLYYGLDSTMEHHMRPLLNRLILSRKSFRQFEQAIEGLHDLAKDRLGMTLPLTIAWTIIWSILCHIVFTVIYYIIGYVLALTFLTLQDWTVPKIRRPWVKKVANFGFWLLTFPITWVALFILGYFVGTSGIFAWRPWAKSTIPGITVSPDFVDGLLNVTKDAEWNARSFHETAAVLTQYGLLHRSPHIGYTVHPHVQWWVRHRIEEDFVAAWVHEAGRLLSLGYQSPQCWDDVFCQQLLIPHLIALAGMDVEFETSNYVWLKTLLQMLYRSLRMVGRM